MRIKVKYPQDCPLRFLDGSLFTCNATKIGELVCDGDDEFPFPENCPLREHNIVVYISALVDSLTMRLKKS